MKNRHKGKIVVWFSRKNPTEKRLIICTGLLPVLVIGLIGAIIFQEGAIELFGMEYVGCIISIYPTLILFDVITITLSAISYIWKFIKENI